LERRGFHVTAVQLPLTSIADDVATVERAGPVLLVGHSYGGIVITEAGDDPKVTALVYISAYAPDAGQSALSLNALVPVTPVGAEIGLSVAAVAFGTLATAPAWKINHRGP
jgi:pimeloyl-ACP methyl ester carboxylesterase